MPVIHDKFLLFRSHECSHGLSDEAVQEIVDAAELVQLDSGDFLHRANQSIDSIFFIVHGRLKETFMDVHGNVSLQRFITRGSQIGALGAAREEPLAVDVVAVEPSAALKLNYQTARQLSKKFDRFGLNVIRLVSTIVSRMLMSDSSPIIPSLVSVFHESKASHSLTPRIIRRLLDCGESPKLMSDRQDWEPIENVDFHPLVQDGRLISREDIRRQINAWSDSGRIIIDVDASIDPASAAILLEFSEQVIWCATPNDTERCTEHLKAIVSRTPAWSEIINLVWIMDNNSWVAPPPGELSDFVERDFKISFSEPQPDQGRHLQNGFERLIHHLRGVRIGLALGGGGARGMAHLGVLKAFEDHGIVIDMIAGTSVGAMTGIVFGAGFSADWGINQFSEDLKPNWFFRMMPRGNDWYLLYKYRMGKFDRMLRKYLNNWTLEQLPFPLQSVTVDLVSGKPVVRKRGDAVDSILESINLPVISKPICRDGQTLIDGGLVNNIPADILVNNGCNFVIAVSVTAHLESEFANNRPDTPTARMASPSVLQTMLRSYLVQNVNMNSIGIRPADVVIEPDVTGVSISDFSRTREMAAIGEKAALQAIPKIKSLLNQVDNRLFPEG